MNTIFGLSYGFHDGSVSAIVDNEIKFAGHSERYSRIKHDANLNKDIIEEAFSYAGKPDIIAYYENPWIKKTRQLYSGEMSKFLDFSNLNIKKSLKKYFSENSLSDVKIKYVSHHLSHAAAGFQTSSFNDAVVVVIDAIGEWDCVSIWQSHYDKNGYAKYKKLYSKKYPNSIGLLYSAFTQQVGLKPLDEEYILMGMSAYGNNSKWNTLYDKLVDNSITLKSNLHAGFIDSKIFENLSHYDIAACAQTIVEKMICNVMQLARKLSPSKNLVYSGGVALNCLANRLLGNYFDNIWIMPNPGDAGNSLGCAAYVYGKKLNWEHPYLGSNIESNYPVDNIIAELLTNKIVGVASGKAEYGPRALGNRSLLADPRGDEIKDKVNEIKRRQKFRPFAPIILEEFVDQYFEMPIGFKTSPYMQVTAKCKYPKQFPAIMHADGTSRVQTVNKHCGSGVRQLLEKWYKISGCPLLLNTSLNIRNEPMVNSIEDAKRFERLYNVKVMY